MESRINDLEQSVRRLRIYLRLCVGLSAVMLIAMSWLAVAASLARDDVRSIRTDIAVHASAIASMRDEVSVHETMIISNDATTRNALADLRLEVVAQAAPPPANQVLRASMFILEKSGVPKAMLMAQDDGAALVLKGGEFQTVVSSASNVAGFSVARSSGSFDLAIVTSDDGPLIKMESADNKGGIVIQCTNEITELSLGRPNGIAGITLKSSNSSTGLLTFDTMSRRRSALLTVENVGTSIMTIDASGNIDKILD